MAGKGVYKWTAIDRICTSVMTFGGNILLANLLDPEDFGLLSMVAIFSALAYNISGCGMSDGLINKKNASERDFSTVFVFNGAMGLFFCILFISTSGLVARYFGYEQLRGIMIAIGICFMFQSLCLVQETRMRKELNFKKMAIVRLSATASSLILAIILVRLGYSYWGLVSMQIFLSFFLFAYYIAVSRWMPRIAFYKDSFKEMFGYGVHLMLAYICYQTARNINTAILGKYVSATSAGAYSQGQKLQETPYSLVEAILNWPFFAVLAAATSQAEHRRLASSMHSVIIFANASLAAFLFVVSTYIFHALYGPKWDAAIPIFNILLIFGIATAMKMFYQTIFKVHAKTRLIRDLTIAEVAIQLLLLAFVYDRGAIIIAWSAVIPAVMTLAVYIVRYIRLEDINFATYLRECSAPIAVPLLITALAFAATAPWACALNRFIALPAVAIVFALIFTIVCELIKPKAYIEVKSRILSRNK